MNRFDTGEERYLCRNDGKTEVYLVLDRFNTGKERYLCRNDGKTEVSVYVYPLRIQRATKFGQNVKIQEHWLDA